MHMFIYLNVSICSVNVHAHVHVFLHMHVCYSNRITYNICVGPEQAVASILIFQQCVTMLVCWVVLYFRMHSVQQNIHAPRDNEPKPAKILILFHLVQLYEN
jgi:hypothetical protein